MDPLIIAIIVAVFTLLVLFSGIPIAFGLCFVSIALLVAFDGFQMLFRVHAPGAGRVTILFKAESDAQIFEAFAPWRAQFGIEMDFTPVIGCQDVVDYHKKLFAKMS